MASHITLTSLKLSTHMQKHRMDVAQGFLQMIEEKLEILGNLLILQELATLMTGVTTHLALIGIPATNASTLI